jgi:hypothetical protein
MPKPNRLIRGDLVATQAVLVAVAVDITGAVVRGAGGR